MSKPKAVVSLCNNSEGMTHWRCRVYAGGDRLPKKVAQKPCQKIEVIHAVHSAGADYQLALLVKKIVGSLSV